MPEAASTAATPMKYAPFVLVLVLAGCGDSTDKKPAPTAPATASATPDAPVAVLEPVTPMTEAQAPDPTADEPGPSGVEIAREPEKASSEKPVEATVDEKAIPSAEAKPVPAVEIVGAAKPARSLDRGEGLLVQVLQEGDGPVVKLGDTVTLEYTISYVPKPEAEKKDDAKKGAKGSKKGDDKKSADKKTDAHKPEADKKSDEAKSDTKGEDKKADEKRSEDKHEEAKAEAKPEAAKPEAAKSEETKGDAEAKPKTEGEAEAKGEKQDAEKSESATKDEAKQKEDKKDEAKPAKKSSAAKSSDKPVETLKPVIVASTKSFTTPFTVRLSSDGKPKLLPGFVRGIEGLKVGTRARILVPAAQAYGKDGSKSAGIPADTNLEIEVFVKSARE